MATMNSDFITLERTERKFKHSKPTHISDNLMKYEIKRSNGLRHTEARNPEMRCFEIFLNPEMTEMRS
jgi:hypothetical protein